MSNLMDPALSGGTISPNPRSGLSFSEENYVYAAISEREARVSIRLKGKANRLIERWSSVTRRMPHKYVEGPEYRIPCLPPPPLSPANPWLNFPDPEDYSRTITFHTVTLRTYGLTETWAGDEQPKNLREADARVTAMGFVVFGNAAKRWARGKACMMPTLREAIYGAAAIHNGVIYLAKGTRDQEANFAAAAAMGAAMGAANDEELERKFTAEVVAHDRIAAELKAIVDEANKQA